VTSQLLQDALEISAAWSTSVDLVELIESPLRDTGFIGLSVDVIALGKASREMAAAAHAVLGDHVLRQLIIVDEGPAIALDADVEFVVGNHPVPGLGSLLAGERLVDFLDAPSEATCTLFLISGGASSLCALPEVPMNLESLGELFAAALESGADITTLNQLRAASSQIAGGAILRHVHTERSLSLIMVDNVVSGERWVASGLTYDYEPDRTEVEALLGVIHRNASPLAISLLDAFEGRRELMREAVTTVHENRVIAEPSRVLRAAVDSATRLGYLVTQLGDSLHGDVQDVVALMSEQLSSVLTNGVALCVVGVGEVTLRVRGSGTGGRCQEFAWRMAEVLDQRSRGAIAAARATDGRDFVKGIAGGWVDESTMERARERGIDWLSVLDNSDSFNALNSLNQLIPGARTGWNLCDVYLVVIEGD
jgi:glycerate 2-kinase